MSPTACSPGHCPWLAQVLPTRVRRNYRGGQWLDRLERLASPADSDRPENWIASTTLALNPGLPPQPDEGLTRLRLPEGTETSLAALLARDPEFMLGAAHVRRLGPNLGFLAKLLDSAMRLHLQAHPTAEFAQRYLNSRYGKLEVYYVLAVRDDAPGTIWLGFQASPGRDGWRRMIETQDLSAMARCFQPIAVKPGDLWIVPGGMPHAIGEGVLMVEIMEPSDWVVRCEFERAGIVVPPEARFMNRGLEFCLDIFDYRARDVDEIRARCQLVPVPRQQGKGWSLEQVVGAERTSCFEIQRLRANVACTVPSNGRAKIVIQTKGTGALSTAGISLELNYGGSAMVAAAAPTLTFAPGPHESEWLICSPAAL